MIRQLDTVTVCGDPVDEGALRQIQTCAVGADRVVLCADHHKGYNMPIGGVAAYAYHVSPAGVGFDIACGNKAVRLDCKLEDIGPELSSIADSIFAALSFGVGLDNAEPVDHPLFDSPTWSDVAFLKGNQAIKAKARNQLGTIGSGNHYVDVFADEKEDIWIGVHFGSRGLGHGIASEFIRLAGANPNGPMDDPPALLDASTETGGDYIAAMELAGQYAYAGRDWVCDRVARIIGAPIVEEVHNHHNFAWREEHSGETYWVVRKGATPAWPGVRGFVGATMGEDSVILEGVESPDSASLLYSTVHGAGRILSRTQAAGKFVKGSNRKVRDGSGCVDMPKVRSNLADKGLHLRGAGADEAPECYKRLPDVLAHHGDTIRVLHTLSPLIVCMAGENEFDPYKD